jgi:hypothetical protein
LARNQKDSKGIYQGLHCPPQLNLNLDVPRQSQHC